MKSYRKELHYNTKTHRAYVNITPQVEAALAESGIREGLCLVNAMHITASVFLPGSPRNRRFRGVGATTRAACTATPRGPQ